MLDNSYVKFNEMTPNNTYRQPFFIINMADKTTCKGVPYVNFCLSDGQGSFNANSFNMSLTDFNQNGITSNMIADVELNVGEKYNTIYHIYPTIDSNVTLTDFTNNDIEANVSIMYDNIIHILKGQLIGQNYSYSISGLALMIYEDYKDTLLKTAAGTTIHHNFSGGLIMHSLGMIVSASKICEAYPCLDKELLICGCALHDIGKIRELKTDDNNIYYTPEGRLLGHSAIGSEIVDDYTMYFSINKERLTLLKHLIISHHGYTNCGAAVEPAIPEAEVLHALDMMDSRIYQYYKKYASMIKGTISDKVFGLHKSIYQPNSTSLNV